MRYARLLLAALLPALTTTGASAQTAARPACDPDNAGLRLADGFCALLVADQLGSPRHLVVAANGDIFVAVAGRSGGVIALRDTNGDGKADLRESFGGSQGSGIDLVGEYLYFSPNDAVVRYPLPAGTLKPTSAPDTLVRGLPTGGHTAKTIAVSADGALYVNIGSRTNSCQGADRRNESPGNDPCTELDTRAGIWRFDATRVGQTQTDGKHFATGLRNVVALRLHPRTGVLYGMQHGRDQLFQNWPALYNDTASAENPSEELVEIHDGDDFGWPYCYHDRFIGRLVLAPEYGGDAKQAGRCAQKKEPVAAFPGHWAPDGLVLYTGDQFPQSYRGGAFIAFHGSWNRAPLPQQGYNVVFQPLVEGTASDAWTVFADGFQRLQPAARPTGIAMGPDGSLYVSDDSGGRIWRILSRSAAR